MITYGANEAKPGYIHSVCPLEHWEQGSRLSHLRLLLEHCKNRERRLVSPGRANTIRLARGLWHYLDTVDRDQTVYVISGSRNWDDPG